MAHDSIYYYKGIGEFKRFIQRIDDRTLSISEALSPFREGKCLSNEFKQRTIQELKDEPSLIVELSQALRNGMAPESKFKLPYKKEEREQELIENIAENYAIDTNKAKAKVVTGHYKNDKSEQEFNYALEVVIAPRTDIGGESAGEIEIIGNINSSPSIDGGHKYFDGAYNWFDKKHKMITSSSIREILQECGFNESTYVSDAKKKVPSLLYINLNTPCPDWLGSAGKTHIDLRPYAADIAQTVSSLAYKMPSYHGMGYGWSHKSYCDDYKQKTAKSYLQDFLYARFDAREADPSIKYKDPLTQSGVWYRIRPVMIRDGFTPRENWGKTREYITGEIDKVCQELFENVEREDLGIVAKARGMMLYDGHTYPVDMDSFEALGRNGVFILVIEKEGIATILEDVAKNSGVALVHTAGRFTKYVKYLIEHARVPVATLTDYDAYGIEISAATIRKTPRIGIDSDIIDWLQQNGYPDLTREDVEEEYVSGIKTDNEYLRTHRIELDSISEKVGPELFWRYVKHKIEELQKETGFDYTNIITEPEPEELHPPAIDNLILKLDEYIEKVVEDDWDTIETELSGAKELISINEREEKNLEVLLKKVAEDETMQDEIVPKINKLLSELSEFLD
jgi:hypothetical protein